MASQHVYGHFLRSGVEIYEYYGRRLHAKLLTVDGVYSSIGSFNLDPISHFHNLEMNVSILDSETAISMEQQFEEDLKDAVRVTLDDIAKRSWLKRLLHWAAYGIGRMLG
jgi:cardiolipin synthase